MIHLFSSGPATVAVTLGTIAGSAALTALLVLLVTLILDWLVAQGLLRSHPWISRWLAPKHQQWAHLGLSMIKLGLRVMIWTVGLGWAIGLIPSLQPFIPWLSNGGNWVVSNLIEVFTTPLFTIGSNKFSLSSILLFTVIALLVFIGSRYLSQWIKQRILRRLGLDRGTQEAVATVIGYVLTALGFVVVLQTAGIDLSSLAVVAGVLGIGLGFGLQNLASNFISGLALLFEQPIKVGDFIEVDGLLGTVEKISIRSTVVRTQDSVFVIVPNIRFIEKNVVNWSYRDPESRIHVPVGVAYGSDTVTVTEALLAAARQEPRVLIYPSPKVWFKRFGDSSLEFELLIWINQPQEFEPIKSALNFLIEQELVQRGIKIPFPQRELTFSNLDVLQNLLGSRVAPLVENGAEHSEVDYAQLPIAQKQLARSRTLQVLLRKMDYFEQCSNAELCILIEQGYQKLYQPQSLICREHEPGDSFYILLSGTVEVISERLDHQIAILKAGDFFGEIALFTGMPRSATVRALEEVDVFVVDRDALQKLLNNHPELAERIAQELAQRRQVLQELGLMRPGDRLIEDRPLIWIRQRLKTLFGI